MENSRKNWIYFNSNSNIVIGTDFIEARIDNTQQNNKSRFLRDIDETINNINEYRKLLFQKPCKY